MPDTYCTKNYRIGIIGAGLGGLQIARQLAHTSASVFIWDRGPFFRLYHEGQDRQSYSGDQRQRDWQAGDYLWGTLSGLKYRVGGRSLCWHGQLLPIEDYAMRAWPSIWTNRLANAYAVLLRDLCDPVAPFPTGSFAWEEAGVRPIAQAATLHTMSTGIVDTWSAYSPLAPVLRQPNLRIFSDAKVTHVAPYAGGVRVFQHNHAPLDVDTVVLAAGAIGNAAILAQTLGTPLHVPLCDHICLGAVLSFRGNMPTRTAVRGDAALIGYLAVPELQANLFFQELPETPAGMRTIDTWVLAEQSDAMSSILHCNPSVDGGSSIAIEGQLHRVDLARAESALARAIAVLTQLLGLPTGQIKCGTEKAAINFSQAHPGMVACYERPLGTIDHESGTHAIDKHCTGNLEVPSVPGLYLSGPGIFPRAGAANPGLTILAIANWLAEHISTPLK